MDQAVFAVWLLLGLVFPAHAGGARKTPEVNNPLLSQAIQPLPALPAIAAARRDLAGYFADTTKLQVSIAIPNDLSGRLRGLLKEQENTDLGAVHFFVANSIPQSVRDNGLWLSHPDVARDIAGYFDGLSRVINAAAPPEIAPLAFNDARLDMRRLGYPLGPLNVGGHFDATQWSMITAAEGSPTQYRGRNWRSASRGEAFIFAGEKNKHRPPLWHRSPGLDEDRILLMGTLVPWRESLDEGLRGVARHRKAAIKNWPNPKELGSLMEQDSQWRTGEPQRQDLLRFRQQRVDVLDYHQRIKAAYETDRGVVLP